MPFSGATRSSNRSPKPGRERLNRPPVANAADVGHHPATHVSASAPIPTSGPSGNLGNPSRARGLAPDRVDDMSEYVESGGEATVEFGGALDNVRPSRRSMSKPYESAVLLQHDAARLPL